MPSKYPYIANNLMYTLEYQTQSHFTTNLSAKNLLSRNSMYTIDYQKNIIFITTYIEKIYSMTLSCKSYRLPVLFKHTS